jgi:succinate dehydrogenase / fumarate reductase cytochrome b subunit
MVYLGFSCPIVAIGYMIATSLLAVHLWHGVDSMFQSIGWRNEKWSCCLRKAAGLFCIAYLLGNLVIPGAVLAKVVKPAANTAAAQHGECCKASCPTTETKK